MIVVLTVDREINFFAIFKDISWWNNLKRKGFFSFSFWKIIDLKTEKESNLRTEKESKKPKKHLN